MLLIFFIHFLQFNIFELCSIFVETTRVVIDLNSLIFTRSNNDNFTNQKKKIFAKFEKKKTYFFIKISNYHGTAGNPGVQMKLVWFAFWHMFMQRFPQSLSKNKKICFSHLLRACIIITHIHRFNCFLFCYCYGTINKKKTKTKYQFSMRIYSLKIYT